VLIAVFSVLKEELSAAALCTFLKGPRPLHSKLLVKRFQYLVGDIDTRTDINSLLKHDIVFFRFGDLLDHLIRAFQYYRQLFVAPLI
jgi:hypothetical protein